MTFSDLYNVLRAYDFSNTVLFYKEATRVVPRLTSVNADSDNNILVT
jgi:hypothetical protein